MTVNPESLLIHDQNIIEQISEVVFLRFIVSYLNELIALIDFAN